MWGLLFSKLLRNWWRKRKNMIASCNNLRATWTLTFIVIKGNISSFLEYNLAEQNYKMRSQNKMKNTSKSCMKNQCISNMYSIKWITFWILPILLWVCINVMQQSIFSRFQFGYFKNLQIQEKMSMYHRIKHSSFYTFSYAAKLHNLTYSSFFNFDSSIRK